MNPPPVTDPRLLRLHALDNILTVIQPLNAGDVVRIDGLEIVIKAPIGLGHKLAAQPIATGFRVVKYGVPIGSATQAVATGDHVHTHNLRSDYLPTHLRGETLEAPLP